jgi:hypothetical protein
MKVGNVALGLSLAALSSLTWAQAPSSSTAPPTSRAQAVDPRAMQSALRLARLIIQEQAQIDATLRMVDTSFIPVLAADESVKALEAEHPGMLKRIADDLRPIFVRYTRRILPAYIERYAAVYAADFSAEELDDLYKLYASPAGQRLIAKMIDNMSVDTALKEAVSDPDAETSLSAVNADHKRSAAAALKQVSDDDKKAFAMLMTKPYFPRMAKIGAKLRKLEQDMINEPDPALDAEIEATIKKSFADHIAAAGKGD